MQHSDANFGIGTLAGACAAKRKRPIGASARSVENDRRNQPRSDALEDVRASHADHAAVRADIGRDPSRDDRRRAHEPSLPDRRYSAICRPIARGLEYDPRTLDASHDVIGDCRAGTYRAAEEYSGEISRRVHCQNLQQRATLALPNRGDEALGRSRNSRCDKKKQSGDDTIHVVLQVGWQPLAGTGLMTDLNYRGKLRMSVLRPR